MADGDSPYKGVKNPYENAGEAKPSLLGGIKDKLKSKEKQEGQGPETGKKGEEKKKEKKEGEAGVSAGTAPEKKEAKKKKAAEGEPAKGEQPKAGGGSPAPEAGAVAQQKKGLFSKLSEKLGKKKEAKPAEGSAEKGGQTPGSQDASGGEKNGLLKKLFKKKEKEEEPISLAPTIVSQSKPPEEKPATPRPTPYEEGIITPTVAPVPHQTFLQKLKGLFTKEPPSPLEIPTHCAVCGIDLHTVYSYTCSNCRKVACYYCMRSFNGKTYCTKCLKEKGIL